MVENNKINFFERFANAATRFTGSSTAFLSAALIVLVWGITGPLFHYSETWQLVINTGTTIITFLMVFLIQKTQNKDSKAIHLKLNELLASIPRASNRLVDVEDLSEIELDALHVFYFRIAELAKLDGQLKKTHTKESANRSHHEKSSKLNLPSSDIANDSSKKSSQ